MLSFGQDIALGRPFGFRLYINRLLLIAMAGFVVIGLAQKNWSQAVWLPMLVFFVLCHEWGHAFVARRFGARVERIVLHIFGGLTSHQGHLGPRQSIFVSLAGPGVNLMLALVGYVLLRATGLWHAAPQSEAAAVGMHLLRLTVWVNVLWGVFNVLPIWPLDGGQVTRTALSTRMAPRQAAVVSAIVSLAFVGIAAVVAGVVLGSFVILLILLSLGYLNVQQYRAAVSSDGPQMGAIMKALRPGGNGHGKGPQQPVSRRPTTLREASRDTDLMRNLLGRCRRKGFGSLSPDERRLLVYHRNMLEAMLARGGFDNLTGEQRELLALHHELDRSREVH